MTKDTAWTIVTGASGFVGRHLVAHLRGQGLPVIVVGRDVVRLAETFDQDEGLHCASYVYDATGSLDIAATLQTAGSTGPLDSVIHLAGVAHQKGAQTADYETGIVDLSRAVFTGVAVWAQQATHHVTIMNLSSIAARDYGTAKRAHLVAYGHAKQTAEVLLTSLCGPYVSAVSWRVPAIWAADAPGPFRLITAFIKRGWPLPFGAIESKRAYISVKNLVAGLHAAACSLHNAPTQRHDLVEVADGLYDLGEVCTMMAQAHNTKARIWPVPTLVLKFGLRAVGKNDLVDQIFSPLTVSQTDLRTLLNRGKRSG